MNKTENERMAIVETKIDAVQNDVGEIKDALNRHIEDMPKNFAGKWVEKGFWIIAGTIITTAIGIMIAVL